MFGNLTGNISLNARTFVNPAVSTTCLIVDASVWYKEWYRFPSDAVMASSRLLTFAFESALATVLSEQSFYYRIWFFWVPIPLTETEPGITPHGLEQPGESEFSIRRLIRHAIA